MTSRWTKKTEKQRNRDRCTLCYFTARTDGSHTPQSLLKGCIYMETAVTIGQMLQRKKIEATLKNYFLPNQTEIYTNTEDVPPSELSNSERQV